MALITNSLGLSVLILSLTMNEVSSNDLSSAALEQVVQQDDQALEKLRKKKLWEINTVYIDVYKRTPSVWELNHYNYNDGAWTNIDELERYVKEYHASLKQLGYTIETASTDKNNVVVGFFKDDKQIAVNLISANDSKMIAIGGSNVLASLHANGVQHEGELLTEGGKKILVSKDLPGVELIRSHKAISKNTSNKFSVSGKTFYSVR